MMKKPQPLTASLLTLSTFVVTAAAWPSSAVAQEVCYQDDVGRIVKRRRPGYTEVPCPQEGGTPSSAPAIEGEGVPPQPPEAQRVVPLHPSLEDICLSSRRQLIKSSYPPTIHTIH